jgi:hypothetical protein
MPESPDKAISLNELLAGAEARGYPASARQAKRLREEGLLRCLGQDHPVGRRGSRSSYAASEADQLALVMRIGQCERRFDQRRVLVAWHGGWVEPDALRRSLVAVLDMVSARARATTRDSDDPAHAAELLLRAPGKDQSSATTKLIRQRLNNPRELQRVMYAFALMAVGGEIAWTEHDPHSNEEPLASIVERATAANRARDDVVYRDKKLAPDAAPAQDIFEELHAAGLFEIEDLAECMRDASDDAIQQAFADARTMTGMDLTAEAIEASTEEDVGGLGSVRALAADGGDASHVAVLVRNMLLMRPIVPDGAFEGLQTAIDGARGPMTAFLEIRRELPEYADMISLDLQAKLAELPEHEAAEIQQKILALLDARPDLRALLESAEATA